MSDLFDLPESPLPPLEAARRRLAKCKAIFDAASPREVVEAEQNLSYAEDEVQRLEQEALRK